MTKCKDCKYYQPDADWHGWCSIEIPAWLRTVITPMTSSRFVRADDGCNLGKKKPMTKRNCFVTQVGDAIEALASALDPERKPPFKGDILDLLEWAEKDVLEMTDIRHRNGEEFQAGRDSHDHEIAELRQQLATLRELKQAWHDKFWEQSKETNQLRKQLADSQTQLEWVKAAYKELKSRVHGPNEHLVWKEAVEHELIVAGIWRRSHESDPKKAVKDVIDWHVQVARDLQLEN